VEVQEVRHIYFFYFELSGSVVNSDH
jgi:hypothetical protein